MSIFFDRVQGDAYAAPSWVRVRVPMAHVPWLYERARSLRPFTERKLSFQLQIA